MLLSPIVYLTAPCPKWCVCLAAVGVSMQCFGGVISCALTHSELLPQQQPPFHSVSAHSSTIQPGCAVPSSPHHCPQRPQSWPQSVLPHARFAVLFTGSLALQPAPFSSLCVGQGLTPHLVKPWIKKHSVLKGLGGIKKHKPLTHRANNK